MKTLRATLLACVLTPFTALAEPTYVFPVQVWVPADAVTSYVPTQFNTFWEYVTATFSQAELAYMGDWDGSGPNDIACDIKIVRDWVDTYDVGDPHPYGPNDCTSTTFLDRFLVGFPLLSSASQSSPCRWDVFWMNTPGPAEASDSKDTWKIDAGSAGSTNDYTLVGWRIAHENAHAVGASHNEPNEPGGGLCNLMHYNNCGTSFCQASYDACLAAGITRQQTEMSMTTALCNRLINDPNAMTRCDWLDQRLDCNASGTVTVSDMSCFSSKVNQIIYGTLPFSAKYDCNYDHAVNVSDITCWNSAVNNHIYDPHCA